MEDLLTNLCNLSIVATYLGDPNLSSLAASFPGFFRISSKSESDQFDPSSRPIEDDSIVYLLPWQKLWENVEVERVTGAHLPRVRRFVEKRTEIHERAIKSVYSYLAMKLRYIAAISYKRGVGLTEYRNSVLGEDHFFTLSISKDVKRIRFSDPNSDRSSVKRDRSF